MFVEVFKPKYKIIPGVKGQIIHTGFESCGFVINSNYIVQISLEPICDLDLCHNKYYEIIIMDGKDQKYYIIQSDYYKIIQGNVKI